MAEEEADPGSLEPIVEENGICDLAIQMPKSIRGNVFVLRRLNHDVVDLMADRGDAPWLLEHIDFAFSGLAVELAIDYVRQLIRKAVAAEEARSKRLSATTGPVKPKPVTQTAGKRKAVTKTARKNEVPASHGEEADRG